MLAFCQILYGATYSWRSVTGGDDGLPGLARPDLIPGISLESPLAYYFFVVAVFIVILAGFFLLVNSPFGLTFKGIRDSEERMRILGYNVWLYKYLAFIIAAFFGGVSGVLHAYYYGVPNPADFSLIHSSSALLMVILGGPGTLLGPLAVHLLLCFCGISSAILPTAGLWCWVQPMFWLCCFFPADCWDHGKNTDPNRFFLREKSNPTSLNLSRMAIL